MIRIKNIVCFCILAGVLIGQTQYTHSIMTYNILNYQGEADDDEREDDLRTVIHFISPDLFMVEEVHGTTGYNHILSDILNYEHPGLYEGAPFIDQPTADIDIALFYKPDLFELLSTTTIEITDNWGNRDALECIILHLSTGIEFRLYGVHLKAGSENGNAAEREDEANRLRNYLNTLDSTVNFLVLGDFNLYYSTEGAFQRLTESQNDNDGQLFDPINRIGDWHNNASFADVHTQSSRDYYQGQYYGGMDDRFDFILASSTILNFTDMNYVSDSYVAVGNDGEHFNEAINKGNNYMVPDSVADALVAASDHIPVYMELQFNEPIVSSYHVVITEIMQNPVVVSDAYGEWFEIYNNDTLAIDIRGWTIRDNGTNNHVITSLEPVIIESGEYFVLATNSDGLTNGGLLVDYEYNYGDFKLTNGSDAVILLDETGAEVDRVEYDDGDTFPDPTGASMALMDVTADNNVGSNWDESTVPYGDGNNMGTPGEANYDVGLKDESSLPKQFKLYQNYPNPFNPVTTIKYQLPNTSLVDLTVYNIRGQLVERLVHAQQSPGIHTIKWDGGSASSGIYFYRITAENYTHSRKLLLLK